MAPKPTPKSTPADPHALSAPEFRTFAMHVPTFHLKQHGIERPSFFAVAFALAQFCDYKSGTRVRPTQVAVADVTGHSPKTVRKVVTYLKRCGALVVVDHQRHGGTPSEVYDMRKSRFVADVLKLENRHWTPAPADSVSGNHRPTQDSRVGTTALLSGNHSPTEWEPQTHNKNRQSHKNQSVDESPSLANAPRLTAVAGEREEEENKKLSMDSQEIDALLGHGSSTAQTAAVAPVAQSATWYDPDEIDDLLANL